MKKRKTFISGITKVKNRFQHIQTVLSKNKMITKDITYNENENIRGYRLGTVGSKTVGFKPDSGCTSLELALTVFFVKKQLQALLVN